MQQIIKDTVGGIWTRFRRASQDEQSTDEVDGETTRHSTTGLKRKAPSHTKREQVIYDEHTNGSGKRGRQSEDAGPEQKRAKQSMAGQQSSLLADYRVPPGSQPITFEPQRREAHDPSNTNGVRSRVGGGRHRIVDTLNEERHTAKESGRFMGGMNQNNIVKVLPRMGLDTKPSRGRNVPAARQPYGDGFVDNAKQSAKRQKVTTGASQHLPLQKSIDLTRDDSQTDSTTATRGNTTTSLVKAHAEPITGPTLDDTPVNRKVDEWTKVEPEKRKRRTRNSQSSGHTSGPGTPEESQLSQQKVQRTFKHPRVEIVLDNIPIDNDKDVAVMSPPPRPNVRQAKPKPRANDVARTRQPPKPDPGSLQDIVESTNIVSTRGRPHNLSPIPREQRNTEQMAYKPPKPEIQTSEQRSNRSETHQRVTERESTRLQDTFVRDSGPVESGQMHRSTRRAGMQATSNGRSSLGSEDELAGESNVPGSVSRSASPQKGPVKIAERVKKTRVSTSQEDLPPSQFKPTEFITPFQSTSKTPPRKKPAAQKRGSEDADEDRIRVRAIYCRSCCLCAGDIQLIRDANSRGYLVEHNGELKTVPNKNQLVNISGQEVRTWIRAIGDDSLNVQIKTSVSQNSSGNICIEFENEEGLWNCYNVLFSASNDTMTSRNETKARMIDIVKNLSSASREELIKALRSKPVPTNTELMRKNQQKRIIRQPDDDEQIRYEDDERPRHSSVRASMQAGSSVSNESRRFTSRHFAQEPERRTLRQTKPVRTKSPTPPPPPSRWSQTHKLQPWSQSVIYPPEGAVRRVTVDSQDIERLDEGEFLNDNLISFGLRRIEENMPPQHKDKVLYFNSFFYSALTTKGGRKVFNYDAVKRWTKNKDLLSMPYVVVPINIDLHWLVAIICNLPNLSRKFDGSDSEPNEDSEMLLNGAEEENVDILAGLSNAIGADADLATANTQTSLRNLSLSDDDKASRDHVAQVDLVKDSVEPSSSHPSTAGGKKSKKKAPPRQRTFDPDAPTIITLDSFGSAHTAETRNLKEYVVAEAQDKRNISLNRDDLQGVTAKGIPEQQNFCDCGLFLIGYIEQFAKHPREFVSKLLRKKQDELHKDFATFDPSKKREEIRDQLLKLHDEQDAERKAKRVAKKSGTCTNLEASKTTTEPSTADAVESQATIDTNEEKRARAISIEPGWSNAASNFEPEISKHAPIDTGMADSEQHNAESNELETAIPRALEDPAPQSRKREALALDSSTVEPPTNEDDESVWEGIESDHELETTKTETCVNVTDDFLRGIEHYASPQRDQPQDEPPQPPALQREDDDQVASRTIRYTASRRSKHVPKQSQTIDVDDDSVVEIKDSQDGFKSSFATEVS